VVSARQIHEHLTHNHAAGYPPSDGEVRDYFVGWQGTPRDQSAHDAYKRSCAFLAAVFEVAGAYVKKLLDGETWPGIDLASAPSLAAKFRLLMTSNPTYEEHGPVRVEFYREVITRANEVRFPDQLGGIHQIFNIGHVFRR
jgi:hypothetical protein